MGAIVTRKRTTLRAQWTSGDTRGALLRLRPEDGGQISTADAAAPKVNFRGPRQETDSAPNWPPGGVGDGWGVHEAMKGFVTSLAGGSRNEN
jgi:hypothetical protein